jgi:hypothetical protein
MRVIERQLPNVMMQLFKTPPSKHIIRNGKHQRGYRNTFAGYHGTLLFLAGCFEGSAKKSEHWWQTWPGILTAAAGLISARCWKDII